MCSHYQTLKDAELLLKKFGVPQKPAVEKYDMWPRYQGGLCAQAAGVRRRRRGRA
ncbi:hypothetical protein D3C87_1032710 [compost metagenome]